MKVDGVVDVDGDAATDDGDDGLMAVPIRSEPYDPPYRDLNSRIQCDFNFLEFFSLASKVMTTKIVRSWMN
ncbi:UNVERIFIED_CONTAM: hypothetical protein Slati_0944300 [Sesamum latifolium]|uniref:Uncharacterized protein n=1 Tax=Sesamum latifolium TaxID=2727402 RepID=A0AAW2XQP8_9LAMI